MKANQKIQIKKLRAVQNTHYPTADAKDYVFGKYNGEVSVPVEYTATGTLLTDIETGNIVQLARDTRNGVVMTGYLTTSPVTMIVKDSRNPKTTTLHTMNSIYEVTEL